MFTHLPVRAPRVPASWLPPAVERLNSPFDHRAWPTPSLAPLDLPAPLRQRLLHGLLAACKQHLQRRALPTDTASAEAALLWRDERESAWLISGDLDRQSTLWLTWLVEIEARLALRVLLAPASAFGVMQTWKAALARQTALAARFARLAQLHDALARRLGSEQALATLDRTLARLQDAGG